MLANMTVCFICLEITVNVLISTYSRRRLIMKKLMSETLVFLVNNFLNIYQIHVLLSEYYTIYFKSTVATENIKTSERGGKFHSNYIRI